jgi:transposase-like protein
MSSRGSYRRHVLEFKIQLCQDIPNGAIGRRDAARHHNLSTNLLQLWLTQYDRGELTTKEAEASAIAEYDARIAALERKVGQLTMKAGPYKKMSRLRLVGDSETSSIITGTRPAPSEGAAKWTSSRGVEG